jgi:hypothetical protein
MEKDIGPIKIRYGGEYALPAKQRIKLIAIGSIIYLSVSISAQSILESLILSFAISFIIAVLITILGKSYYKSKNAKKYRRYVESETE